MQHSTTSDVMTPAYLKQLFEILVVKHMTTDDQCLKRDLDCGNSRSTFERSHGGISPLFGRGFAWSQCRVSFRDSISCTATECVGVAPSCPITGKGRGRQQPV